MSRRLTTGVMTITLAVVLTFSGCGGTRAVSEVQVSKPAAVEQVQGEKPTARTASHECGAQTKVVGKPCTRKVKEGVKFCWQHKGQE